MALTFELLRPDDLLALRVEVRNLKLDTSDRRNPKLVVDTPGEAAYLILQFPAQSITEKAYFETKNAGPGSDKLDPAGSVPARMTGNSRLVFRLPKNINHIPFTMAALLDWSKLELMLSPTALGKPVPPPIIAPKALHTALEIPYHIILSPASAVGWNHAKKAVTHDGRTEIWHTRIGKFVEVKTKSGKQKRLIETTDQSTVPLRAIWSPDFVDHGPLPGPAELGSFPYLAPTAPRDRAEFVILTSGASGYFVATASGSIPWVPVPIEASRLFLSSLGGWLSSRGRWPLQPSYHQNNGGAVQSLDISEWVHVATQARDHYVRIVYEGFLYPFGHRAALIKVTERKVVPPDGGVVQYPTAYLKQYEYIIVREKDKTYPAASYQYGAREMPLWKSVRIRTLITPDIDKQQYIAGGSSFWINVGGSGFPFHISATDLAGKTIDFLAQLIFMDESEPTPLNVQKEYKTPTSPKNQRVCSVSAQKVTYADPSAGDTALKTASLYFDTEMPANAAPPYPVVPFVPFLDQAGVTVPALEEILGTSTPVTIQLYGKYLSGGLDKNTGVFATINGGAPLKFSADKAGGFSTPNLTLTGLSAKKGVVAGNPDDAANGLIKPKEFFDLSAQLFGTVPLQALVQVDGGGQAPAGQNAPEIRTVPSPNQKNPTALITKFSWSPQVKSYPHDPVRVLVTPTSALTLKAQLTRSLKGAPPTSDIRGELSNFQIFLVGAVAISFNSLTFTSKNGQKLNVKADLPASGAVAFQGPLAFVQKLADILPPGIFGGKGPSIDLLSDRLRVTYTLGLPPISVGVFSLEHISIMTGLDLPYLSGMPALEFGFASRSAPFLLTVECLGGGGFVHLIATADGIQMVEGALEFGGEFSLDLGVASGGVHIMAGIYFKLSGTDNDLTGFVDVGGEVSVLGIISISLDLNLSLSYEVKNGKKTVEGKATLTVSVHVLFFSASVQISMEKSFAAGSIPPKISDVLTLTDWEEYAGAFGCREL